MSSTAHNQFPRWFGKYLLLDEIARGGMAHIYRARVSGAEKFQRLLAIKCLRPELARDDQFTAMFIDEANVAAQMTHANIVQVYELGKHEGCFYIAMELVSGRDLRQILAAARQHNVRLPPAFCAYVVARAADGLDFAHRKNGVDGKPLGLVHRDVSPQNILVSFYGEVKVLDFGIAKARLRSTETQAGVFKGNLSHMSPEQATGAPLDRRSDIFGLGTVLFELLTGHKLYEADNDYALITMAREADVSHVRAADAGFAPAFEAPLLRCLARDPAARFAFASELLDALTPILVADGHLFGAKDAAAFLETLFAEEIKAELERLRHYSELVVEKAIAAEPAAVAASPQGGTAAVAGNSTAEMSEWQIPTSEMSAEVIRQRISEIRAQLAPYRPASDPRSGSGSASSADTLIRERPLRPIPALAQDPDDIPSVLDVVTHPARPAVRPVVSHRRRTVLVVAAALVALSVAGIVIGLSTPSRTPSRDQSPAATATASPAKDPAVKPPPVKETRPTETSAEEAGTSTAEGFISVRTPGARNVRIYVDGVDVGRAPLTAVRVRVGKHVVKVVELRGSKPVKSKTTRIVVTEQHTRRAPARLVLAL